MFENLLTNLLITNLIASLQYIIHILSRKYLSGFIPPIKLGVVSHSDHGNRNSPSNYALKKIKNTRHH